MNRATLWKLLESNSWKLKGATSDPIPVHCDMSLLVLSSGSGEVTKVPVHNFLQIATTSWNSIVASCAGLLLLQWGVRKAVAKIQHYTYHDGACPLWIEMFVKGELGQNKFQTLAVIVEYWKYWVWNSAPDTEDMCFHLQLYWQASSWRIWMKKIVMWSVRA